MITQEVVLATPEDAPAAKVRALVIGHLALHAALGSNESDDDGVGLQFTLTHIASGFAVASWKPWAYILELLVAIDEQSVDFSFQHKDDAKSIVPVMRDILNALNDKYDR